MAGFVNNVLFTPTLGGTTDWVVSAAVAGYNTPAGAGAVNGTLYKYRAESADLTEWEIGEGAYTVGSTTLARTTVLLNSAGTTAKINFTTVPSVGIVALAEDLIGVDQANSFTSGQQAQARTNIAAAPLASPTFTGTPAAPTASPGTNTTQLATTAFVEAARVILAAADATVAANAANASNLTSGTVGTARLGSGTANNLTYLRGDQTWSYIGASITASGDLNNLETPGFYDGTALTNSPDGSANWFYVLVQRHSGWVTTTNEYLVQTAWSLGDATMYTRVQAAGSWGAWKKMLVAGNNLSDVASVATARTNLGAAPAASPAFTGNGSITGTFTSAGFSSTAASVNVLGDIYAVRTATQGVVYLGSSGGQYIYFDGTQFNFAGGGILSPTLTGTPTAPTAALDTNTTQLATTAFVQTARSLSPGFVSIKVQNNTTDANNDIDFLAGRARDSTDVDNIVLASTLVKRLDAAWAVGTNQGGIDTGSKANNTFYYLWAIKRTDTGVVDALFSTSATAPTMPASYTLKQRVGAVRTDGSGNIRAFFQHANQLDYFQYVAPIADVADTSLASASRDAFVLTVPPGSIAKFRAVARDPTTAYNAIAVVLTTASENDSAPDLASSGNTSLGGQFATYYGAGAFSGEFEVLADGSSQIYARAGGGTDTAIYIRTKGFVLQRGIF